MNKKKIFLCSLLIFICTLNLSAAVFDSILDLSNELYKSSVEDTKIYEKLLKKVTGINSPKDCEKLNEKDSSGFTAFQYIAMTPGTDEIFSVALEKYNNYMPYQLYNFLNKPIANIKISNQKFKFEDFAYDKVQDDAYLKYNKKIPSQFMNVMNSSNSKVNYPEKEYNNHVYTTDLTFVNFSLFLYVLYNEGMSEKINLLLSDNRFNSIIDYNTEGKIETSDQSFRIRPLTIAVRSGNQKLVEFLLNKKVEVNYTMEKSYFDSSSNPINLTKLTPLIEAVRSPKFNIDIIKALLNKKANINVGYNLNSSNENYENYSPLFIAIDQNDYNLFDTIYSLYSNPASQKVKFLGTNWTTEYTPLHWAINKESINEPIVERLFDAETSQQTIKKEDGKIYTAAEVLLARNDISNSLRNRAMNIDGEVRIFEAIENTNYEDVHTILESGLSANLYKNNHSAFEYAVEKAIKRNADEESLKIVEDLLSHGANVNAIGTNSKTMFVTLIVNALEKGFDDTTRKLLRLMGKYKLDATLPIENNLPVLHYVVNLIGQKVDKEVLSFLLEKDFKLNINQRVQGGEYNNWTPLLFAIQNGNSDLVQYLIDNGADVNSFIKQDESNLFTPLALAFERGQEKCANLLLDNGARQTDLVSMKGADKVSILMLACSSSDWSMVSRLLDNPELKINNFDSLGRNSFMYAAIYNKDPVKAIKILRNLRGRKAVITHKDFNGDNAYTLAFRNNQKGDTLLWLLEHGVPVQYKVSNIEMYVDDVEYYNVLKEICDIKE